MNPNIKHGGGGNRNFGLKGAGKGDADRTSDKTAYNENLEGVAFPRVALRDDPTFFKTKRGYKKVYGTPEDRLIPFPDDPIPQVQDEDSSNPDNIIPFSDVT